MTALLQHCPLGCNSTLETTDFTLPEGALRRCTACAQLISSCSVETFEKTMQEWDNEDGTMPTGRDAIRHRKRITKLLKHLLRFIGKSAESMSLLDVGCSSGSSLQVALDFGFGVVKGVEPAQAPAETAISNGFDVTVGFLEDACYKDSSFDVILLFEVIEHLPEPLPLIKEIHRILKPGGILLLSTGNALSWTANVLGARWTFFSMQEHGGHISFFSPQSIRILAELTKFTLLDVQTRRMILTERAISTRLTYKPLKLASELLSPLARMAGKGHQMYAYLNKV
ncbi:MAG: class I SAM-dependent methyltransferase [Mariprofundus sp.]|nr:class I SAM-dependent methyltransferase [Mariprofundus sp.]